MFVEGAVRSRLPELLGQVNARLSEENEVVEVWTQTCEEGLCAESGRGSC